MKASIKLSMLIIALLCSMLLYAQEFARANEKELRGKAKAMNAKSMQGAFTLQRMVMTQNGRDTKVNIPMMKIFADGYMMYVRPLPSDSLGEFAVGTYKVVPGKVTEDIFYQSSSGTVKESYELQVNPNAAGYTQRIDMKDDQGKPWVLYEEYSRKSGKSSPLDGAWKQTGRTYTDEKGTSQELPPVTQFKFYQSGQFAWASTENNPQTNKSVSFYGFGSFNMKGKDAIVEKNVSSTFATELVNREVTVQVSFPSADTYEQVITWPNGSKLKEVYTRLK